MHQHSEQEDEWDSMWDTDVGVSPGASSTASILGEPRCDCRRGLFFCLFV